MSEYSETNVDQLVNAGVLKADHSLSEEDQAQINDLSAEEINHVIGIGDKLDEGFFDRNSSSFAHSNFI